MVDAQFGGVLGVVLAGQAAGGDDFDPRINGFQGADGRRAVHDRHRHVGEDSGDFILPGTIKLDGLGAVGGQQGLVAKVIQHFLRDSPDVFLVIHHQHQFIVAVRQFGFDGGAAFAFRRRKVVPRPTSL